MRFQVVRTHEEIERVWQLAEDGQAEGSKYPGMSYEDGIDAVLRWLESKDMDHPFEE